MRALISVYDKNGAAELARGLADLGWEIVASGGTAAVLEEHLVPVTPVASLTGFAEILDHRVVTLHPAVHGGILARRDIPEDLADLEAHGIEPIDLVVVNLYPFTDVASRRGVTEEEAVEMIDIGGPALLRAAAKNFLHVGAVARPERYEPVLEELRQDGRLSLETRRSLAGEAFVVTAAYESAISAWFSDRETFPEGLIPTFWRERSLAYGENPHQRAAYYAEAGARRHLLSRVEQLRRQGALVQQPQRPLGRARPRRGVHAAHVRDRQAREPVRCRGRGRDRGGVRACARLRPRVRIRRDRRAQPARVGRARRADRRAVRRGALRARIRGRRARDAGRKEALRILDSTERRHAAMGERDYRRVLGGLLAQDRDGDVEDREGMIVVCGEPSESDWGDLLFSWRVCKHVTSNAIVIAKDLRTIGVGAGQMSRVDAVRIAVEKAREHGHDLEGARWPQMRSSRSRTAR